MKIDRANKAKMIIFASMGIAIILVIMLFIFSSSKEDKIEDVSVRMEEQSDLTINDILSQQEHTPSSYDSPALIEAERSLSEDYVVMTEDDDVRRLQEQLRSMNAANSYDPTPDYSYQEVVPSRPQKRSISETQQKERKEVSSPVVIEEQEVLPQKEEAPKKKSRFFSSSNQTNGNTIEAKVSGEQKVKSGGTLKLVLAQDVVLSDGTLLQKGTPLFGQVELSKNRLQVHISSIRIKNDILPFRKTVYDRDGLAGIYIPDNTTAEIASDATSMAVSNATIGATGSAVVDGTVQVIESVAKGAMQKKQARPTITIKSNYKVLLQ